MDLRRAAHSWANRGKEEERPCRTTISACCWLSWLQLLGLTALAGTSLFWILLPPTHESSQFVPLEKPYLASKSRNERSGVFCNDILCRRIIVNDATQSCAVNSTAE